MCQHPFKWQHTLTGPQKASWWDLAAFQETEAKQVQMGKASLKSEMSLSSLQRRTWIIIYQKLGILINFHCAGCSTHYSKTKTLLFSKTKGSQTLRPRTRSVKSIWAGIFPLGFPEMEKRFSCLCTAASMEKHEGISRSIHCIMQSILLLREAGRKGKN